MDSPWMGNSDLSDLLQLLRPTELIIKKVFQIEKEETPHKRQRSKDCPQVNEAWPGIESPQFQFNCP